MLDSKIKELKELIASYKETKDKKLFQALALLATLEAEKSRELERQRLITKAMKKYR